MMKGALAASFALFLVVLQPAFPPDRGSAPRAETVQLSPHRDNTLYQSATGGRSNGSGYFFFSGRIALGSLRRGLFAFPVADSIPQGSVIDSVSLRLHCSHSSSPAMPISFHRALSDWGEGASDAGDPGGLGAPSEPGDATWIHRFFNTVFWPAAGGEFAAIPSATDSVADTTFYTWSSTPALVSDVQGWLDDPASQFGWFVIGREDSNQTAKRFDSREHPDPALRPLLTVHFSPMTSVTGPAGSHGAYAGTALAAPVPNPLLARSSDALTRLTYSLSRKGQVRLSIHDVSGRQVAALAEGLRDAGIHHAAWTGRDQAGQDLPSGVYFVRLQTEEFREMQRLVLLR